MSTHNLTSKDVTKQLGHLMEPLEEDENWEPKHVAKVAACALNELDRQRAEIERLTRELRLAESARDYANAMLDNARSSDETTIEWLTDKQCDDVIAFLEDYEWSGLTRESVRTWCTAIAEARSSVKASGEHVHTDECWEPDSGCDMGRNEAHAVAEERCEHGIPRRFCTAVHPSENGSTEQL